MGSLVARLRRWLGGRSAGPPRPELAVVLYTRQGCHLCEEAHKLLEAHRARHRFRLDVVDIDTDAAFRARYDQCVPVVSVNGKVRFRGRVNPVLLERLLANTK